MKRLLRFGLILLLLACCCAASGESARVITPGGKLKMRKSADAKAKVVAEIPNRALVELGEIEGDWAQVTYQKKTGYVMTEFLRLPQALVDQWVYSDKGTLYLLLEPASGSPLAGVAGQSEKVYVEAVSDGWAKVALDDRTGYVETTQLSYQYSEPQGDPEWLSESGVTVQEAQLRRSAEAAAPVDATLQAGQAVTVTEISGSQCLVLSDEGCGWTDCGNICLTAPEDAAVSGQTVSAMDAVSKAGAALKKKYKAYGKASLYTSVSLSLNANGYAEPAYRIGFLNDEDQFCYSALVDAESGKVVLTADLSAFAAPARASLLPQGEMNVTISSDQLSVGEVLEIDTEAWTRAKCRYSLTRDGQKVFAGENTPYFAAAYRPRAEGSYTLTVAVTDDSGLTVSRSVDFTVSGTAEGGQETIYSQKDGWWKDKAYRQSTLDKSGCAIFTLSHALDRLGYTGDEILPETWPEPSPSASRWTARTTSG